MIRLSCQHQVVAVIANNRKEDSSALSSGIVGRWRVDGSCLYISGSFCVSITAAMGMPKLETGPQKSVGGEEDVESVGETVCD